MRDYFFLIPIAIVIGAAALGAFLWSLRNAQYEDLDGAAERVLYDEDRPLPDRDGTDRSKTSR